MSQRESVPNTEDFVVKIVGESTGVEVSGKFTAKKRLSFNDQLRRDQYRRQMLGAGDGEPSARAASMAQIFSETLVRLITAPSWWTDADEGRELSDENVVVEVYQKVLDIEKRAVEEVQAKAKQAMEDLKGAIATDEASIK